MAETLCLELALAVAESIMQAGLGGLKWGVEGSFLLHAIEMNVIEIYP